ncbi:hypothetical protein GQ53DRAFT_817283 [Thozetella sp. PMI_491]|nr:hypothetical protein GQ53DRAFT_817283 [Thozetella sp. PMI_491]
MCDANLDGWVRCKNSTDRFWLGDDFDQCDAQQPGAQCYCICPELLADPDVAGIGVIIAFIASAGLTIIATAVCLLFSRTNKEPGGTYNSIDRFFRDQLCDPLQKLHGERRCKLIAYTAYDVVLSLSDTQLVTGIAMLIAALIRLAKGLITVYHFSIVTDLVWLASSTHGLSLMVVRSFDESVKPERRDSDPSRRSRLRASQFAKWVRAILMLCMAGMLFACCFITGYVYWYDEFRCPANCTLDSDTWYLKGGVPLQWMVVNFVFILWDYTIGIFMLIRLWREWWISNVRPLFSSNFNEPDFEPGSWKAGWAGVPLRLLASHKWPRVILKCVWHFFGSEFTSFLQTIAWFSLGIYWIFGQIPDQLQDRPLGHSLMENPDEQKAEDEITGFGQLIPIVLLLIPILQLFEAYAARSTELQLEEMKKQLEANGQENRNQDQQNTGAGQPPRHAADSFYRIRLNDLNVPRGDS